MQRELNLNVDLLNGIFSSDPVSWDKARVLCNAKALSEEVKKLWRLVNKSEKIVYEIGCKLDDYDIIECGKFDIRPFDPSTDVVSLRDGGTDISSYVEMVAEKGAKLVIFNLETKMVVTIYGFENSSDSG